MSAQEIKVTVDGQTYLDCGDGWYARLVPAGSSDDNTQGQVGRHMMYPMAQRGADVDQLRLAMPALDAARQAAEAEDLAACYTRATASRLPASRHICPQCHTYCDGDCHAG